MKVECEKIRIKRSVKIESIVEVETIVEIDFFQSLNKGFELLEAPPDSKSRIGSFLDYLPKRLQPFSRMDSGPLSAGTQSPENGCVGCQ